MTKTKDAGLNLNVSLNSLLARGGNIEFGNLAFDSSYPIGGESLTFPNWRAKPKAVIIPDYNGYSFQYDRTNAKVKAFTPGRSLIVEEAVTVASNAGNLAHKPFYILSIDVTAGTTTGPFSVIPTGETPLTTQCAVTFTSGALTFLAGDAVTAAKVTYIPLHETGPFSSDNLVVDETITASADKTDLANQAAAVQYVWDDTDGVIDGLEPVGEAPSATHKAVVDIDAGSSDTNIDFHADDADNSIKVTYIKYAAFDAAMQLGDGDTTLTSEEYNWTENHYNYLAIPGLGTACVGETGADANVELIWSGPSESVAAGVPVLYFPTNDWQTDESTAVATLAMPVILLNALSNHGAMLEVGNGTDLSGLSAVPYVAIGF